MLVATYMLNLVAEVRGNVASLESSVNAARDSWDDVNYERIALRATDSIRKDTEAFYQSVKVDAECIYNDTMRINLIVNNPLAELK